MAKNVKNRGKHLERLVESANKSYRLMGRANISKNEVQNKFIRGRMIYTEKADPDFSGCIRGGKYVAFDCKSTKENSFPLKLIAEREHQLEHLTITDELGGIGFYLVYMERHGKYFVLPVAQALAAIQRAEAGGRKSIPLQEFKFEVKGDFSITLDYLAALPLDIH